MSGLALVADARRLGASRGGGAAALWRMSAVADERALFWRPSSREQARVIGLLPRASFLPPEGVETGWWKIDAVLDFAARRGLDRVVWLDNELPIYDPRLGVTYREAAEDALADAGITPFLVAPDPTLGLTVGLAELVEDFAARRLWTLPAYRLSAPAFEPAV
ncbi:hypothetical protein [Sinomonas sp.]|uniref:hypothetical protein n=1 Tax=Sinomonas sp. TaxID=1914986 RepID=UPI002FDF2C8A